VTGEPPDTSESGLRKTHLIRELVDLSRFTEGILRTMGAAVVAARGDGTVVYVNPAAELLLRRPARELMDQPVSELLVTRGSGDLASFARENPDAVEEVDLALGDDRYVTVEARISPYPGENGEPDGLVAILTDLTSVKDAEQQARRKEQLASLGELSAGVAHEIRNPLSGIAASAQLIQSRIPEEDRNQKLVSVILEEAHRLNRIVDSLLEFARPPHPRLQRTNILKCIRRSMALVEDHARSSGVTVTSEFEEELPYAWIDGDQMEQVYLNLLRNAVEAMEDGGTLTVTAGIVRRPPYVRRSRGRRAEDNELPPPVQPTLIDWVEVAIGDTGPGIEDEILERVFDPFFTTRRKGTGLGLAICQSIIHEHSGMIRVDSHVGTGTTFSVDLPVEKRQGRRRRD